MRRNGKKVKVSPIKLVISCVIKPQQDKTAKHIWLSTIDGSQGSIVAVFSEIWGSLGGVLQVLAASVWVFRYDYRKKMTLVLSLYVKSRHNIAKQR